MTETSTPGDPRPISSGAAGGSTSANRLAIAEWVLIVLGSAVLLTLTLNATSLNSANDRSRWSTVWSLAERGTYQIDEIDPVSGWTTIDKVHHEGHFYSTKPPMLSTAVAGVYWCLKTVFGFDLLKETQSTTQWILMLVNWLPMSIAFLVMARIVARSTASPEARLLTLATFCFATLATGYSVTLNNHSIAAVFAVFALAPTLRILSDGSDRRRDFVASGFWAALVCCHELPAALLGVALFLLMCRRSVSRTAMWFVPAALIPLAVFFVTNWIATGGWKPFYMYYGTEKYLYVVDGVRSYWHEPKGMDQSNDSPLTYFLQCTIGHHGIFSLSPIFLLMLGTWFNRSWWSSSRLRPAIAFGLGLTIVVLGFYLTRTDNYNYGGNTFGLRWMLWLTPFWVLSLVPAFERVVGNRWMLAMTFLLLTVSVYSSLGASRNPWSPSWVFNRMKSFEWIDYSDPPPKFPFKRKLYTWFSNPADDRPVGTWVEFTSTGTGSDLGGRRQDTIRMKRVEASEFDGGTDCVRIEIRWNENRPDAWTATVDFDVQAFYAGKKLTSQITDFESDVLSKQQLLTFLRAVPVERSYRPGVFRHVRTALRKDAFRCQRSATQVYVNRQDGKRVRHRCDIWLNEELPFGVVQFEISEYGRSGELFTRRRFVATGCSEIGQVGD